MDSRFEELNALRAQLRRLPAFMPPADAWQRIDRALDAAPAGLPAESPAAARPAAVSASSASHWRYAAVAAGLLPVCALALFWLRREPAPVAARAAAPVAADSVEMLVDRSQQLEAMLQQLPPRPAVERAGTSAAIEALQSRIQLLDMALSLGGNGGGDEPQAQQLWGERVQLLNSLVGMRYAEAVRVDVQAATQDGAI